MPEGNITVNFQMKDGALKTTIENSSEKETPVTIRSWEDVDRSLLRIGKEEAFIAKKEAELNKQVQLLTDKAQIVTEYSRNTIKNNSDAIMEFCIKNKDQFKSVKSKTFSYGEVGFRSLPGKIQLISKKFNWEIAVKLVREIFGKKYLRVSLELNKEKLLEASQRKRRPLDPGDLQKCGIKIQKGEKFFLQAKWEEVQKEAGQC